MIFYKMKVHVRKVNMYLINDVKKVDLKKYEHLFLLINHIKFFPLKSSQILKINLL